MGSIPIASSIVFGGIPERPKGADCKSAVFDFEGSNPSPSTIHRGVEQLVARRAHNPKVAGSSPVPATTKIHSEMIVHCAGVAQSAERILGKDKVTGSIPVTSSIHGGIAQLARAIGSYPVCPRFKSVCRHH